ncbi:MAG TPA: S8 family serine peptidase, partial [Candidatus Kapabacteria bacterium]|nr:S8 family serine peptidase [Candidatus Kapabacteria bacterium]
MKFRSVAAMGDSSVLAQLRSISASSDIMRPVFQRPVALPVNSIQQISTDTIGLNRIMQIPLREGITAQDAVRELSSRAEFEYVEPNYRYHIQSGENVPNDPLFSAQWWLENVHAPEAWQITEGDSTIHIGFVDTGVNWLHPDLRFQFAVNPAEDINHDGLFEAWPSDSLGVNARGDTVTGDLDGKDHDGNGYANDVIGYNFINSNSIPQDEHGHGTDIAGILAAQQNNHTGISGIAPKCKLVALRAFDANGIGQDDKVATAIVYAADNHIQILNLSFGDVVPSLLQRDAIRYAISKGVTVFGSSGNSTYSSEDPNYPSDFDEVVSVGGTTSYPSPDNLWPLTTHGEEMDVVAPSAFILTTNRFGGYDSVTGTSAASPIAAGIAALLLSRNSKLTPIELRSIIESTTQDVGDPSYDHRSANGRVDAYGALSYLGSAQIKMVTPHSLDEFRVGDTVHFTGSAMSTLFTGYTIDFGKGSAPDSSASVNNWNNIVSSNSQVLNGALASWDTHGLDTGLYTIRLAVQSSDSRSTEEHCIIRIASAPPKFRLFRVDSIYIAIAPNVPVKEGLVVLATSDIPCQLEVRYAALGARFSVKSDDHLSREHWVMLSPEEAERNDPLTIDAVLRAPNGDTTNLWDTASVTGMTFPEQGFDEKPYSLPSGFALDSILTAPTGDEIAETPDASGHLTMYLFDSTKHFLAVDSVDDGSLPRAIGNTVGDNRPELLVQSLAGSCAISDVCGHTAIYKQNDRHSLLGDRIYENDTLFGSTFASLTEDHKQCIAGSFDSAYQAYVYSNGRYALLGSMVDPSNSNALLTGYSEPHAGHADLLGNGVEELITMDNEANLVIYEYDSAAPAEFRAVYIDSNIGVSNGAFVTTGDFDGDGKPDIAYAFHPNIEHDTLGEYPFAYWTLKVLQNLGGMKFQTILNTHFYDPYSIYDPNPVDAVPSSLSRLRNVTGHSVDDLALCLFPNFYLMEYDSSSHTMIPIWRYPSAESRNGAISYDFDRNGKREFGFFTGDSIHFFEHSDFYTEQTPAPAGLNVSPRDTNRVDLEWAPVEGATEYYILRAGIHDLTSTVIGSTASTFYSDTTVSNGDDWIYSVAAFAPSYSMPNSAAAFSEEAIVHPMPRL